jgi:hypothetical protein
MCGLAHGARRIGGCGALSHLGPIDVIASTPPSPTLSLCLPQSLQHKFIFSMKENRYTNKLRREKNGLFGLVLYL